jgi:hypothetical protein
MHPLLKDQRQTVFRIWRNTDAFSRDLLALVMGVPDEDRAAFDDVLHNWLHWMAEHDSEWDFDPKAHPIPSDALEDFWQEHSPHAVYFGSALEEGVLAQRAQNARRVEEMQRVLVRMAAHVRARPSLLASEIVGFFNCLLDALDHGDFDERCSAAPVLKVAA